MYKSYNICIFEKKDYLQTQITFFGKHLVVIDCLFKELKVPTYLRGLPASQYKAGSFIASAVNDANSLLVAVLKLLVCHVIGLHFRWGPCSQIKENRNLCFSNFHPFPNERREWEKMCFDLP